MELDLSAGEMAGAEIPQDRERVGDRRLDPAATVTGGPGVRAGAMGAHAQQAAVIDPADGPSAGPDRADVHQTHAERNAPANVPFAAEPRPTVDDRAHVEAGSAHVGRYEVRSPEHPAEARGADAAASGPGVGPQQRTLDRG